MTKGTASRDVSRERANVGQLLGLEIRKIDRTQMDFEIGDQLHEPQRIDDAIVAQVEVVG